MVLNDSARNEHFVLALVSKVRRVFERWLVVFNKKEKREGVCWLLKNRKFVETI